MIIKVTDEQNSAHYISFDFDMDNDRARSIAFRFVYKRKEHDYNELAHHALVLDVESVSVDAAKILWSHVR